MNHVAPGSVLKFIRILCTASLGRTQFSIIHKKKRSTSRTVRGGCGSFKNREPIGEIGCCE